MELVVLGAGAAYPGPGQASSGYLIRDGATSLLLDCGNGIVPRLQEAGELERLSAILFSHLHADHFLDIYPLFYSRLYGKRRYPPLPVFLPPGEASQMARVTEVLRVDTQKFGEAFHLQEFDPAAGMEYGGLRLSFQRNDHPVTTFGVRVEKDGAAFVYSSDTGPMPQLEQFARGCDLLVIEASVGAADFDPKKAIHLTPGLAGEVAARAGAKRMLLTHMWPHYDRGEMLREAQGTFPGAELAEELKRYPVGAR